MKKKKENIGVPIKFMLNIPLVKLDLRDEKGNIISDVVAIQELKGRIYVITKDGFVYKQPK